MTGDRKSLLCTQPNNGAVKGGGSQLKPGENGQWIAQSFENAMEDRASNAVTNGVCTGNNEGEISIHHITEIPELEAGISKLEAGASRLKEKKLGFSLIRLTPTNIINRNASTQDKFTG
ncbi:hypothetical protein Acr_19g0003720 [Actinidia rufa]|uniref:Uncharacterized protein n=1 Tax=Actinidia rufa TaxID=165716 RepID=A0A7J0G9F1_9ERIC|nr:hypothetical protein Acr_19g0003720 [Actinidia rufa]